MTPPRLSRERVEALVQRFRGARVCVFGDMMLDRYFWGEADRISPEAPVPVVRVTRRSVRLGGAANVAANLRGLGVRVVVAGAIGDDREGDELVALLDDCGVEHAALARVTGRETTEKVRIIARNQQVVRADFEAEDGLAAAVHERMVGALRDELAACDALVVSDYGKGVVEEAGLRDVIGAWTGAGKPVLVDPYVPHFRWYAGASVVTPNTRQAYAAAGISFRDGAESAARRAHDVRREIGLGALLVTRGEDGMSLFGDGGGEVHIPTVAKEVYDVTGAGDTVIGVLAACLATGVDVTEAMVLANRAAGEVVKEVGTSPVTGDVLLTSIDTIDYTDGLT